MNMNILIIDDEDIVLSLFERFADFLKFNSFLCKNADEAKKVISENNREFDMAIVDMNLKGMSGLELAKEVKREIPGIKILLSSGDEIELKQAFRKEKKSIDGILIKPFSIEDFKKILQSYSQE